MGADIGLLPNTGQQVNDLVNKQENGILSHEHLRIERCSISVPSRISRLYPKYSETSSSSSSSSSSCIGLQTLIDAANICLEKRLHSHTVSDENFSKLKLALEQMHTTIERTEQVHKTLDHLEHLPKHIHCQEPDRQEQKTTFDHIATRFYPSIDCGQQARDVFRDQMSKQTPSSFVTCCNTIVTTSVDETSSDFMNDDTTIIRCQLPTTVSQPERSPSAGDDGMLKGLECLLLSEPMAMTTNNDESFLTLEQECRMDSEIMIDRPRRKTIVETNVAAVNMDDRMEEDDPQKENITPQPANDVQFDKLEQDVHFISPIISVPIGQ